jgi:hypothetical protein
MVHKKNRVLKEMILLTKRNSARIKYFGRDKETVTLVCLIEPLEDFINI